MTLITALVLGILRLEASSPKYMQNCDQQYAFCNTSLPFLDRTRDLVSRLTLAEKIAQLSTYSIKKTGPGGHTPGVERLGIPEYCYHSEGLHGIRDSSVAGFQNSTLFPQVTGMAATGNVTLIREMGRVMGREARAVNNAMRRQDLVANKGGGLSYYGPTINIIRDPRWGRNQETVSEDPWLTGQYAAAIVRGMQDPDAEGDGDASNKYLAVGATCKHLAAYGIEQDRLDSNANVTMLDLAETYLPAFEACVAADPAQIMCSYNQINGVGACISPWLQNGILRRRWGFGGLVVSDCDAIKIVTTEQKQMDGPHAAAAGVNAGCDLDCGNWYSQYGQQAVDSKLLNESVIDEALRRVFMMRFRLGEMGETDAEVSWRSVPPSTVGAPRSLALSEQAAREAMTLLKNDKGALPLARNQAPGSRRKKLAVVGPLGDDAAVMMGGKKDYNAGPSYSVLQGLNETIVKKGYGWDIAFAAGLDSVQDNSTDGFKDAVAVATDANAVILVIGVDPSVEKEGRDRDMIGLPGAQVELVNAVLAAAQSPGDVIVVLIGGGPVSIDNIAANVQSIIAAHEAGQFGGRAVAATLFGDVNPSGALPYTIFPEGPAEQVSMYDFQMRPDAASGYPGRTYRFSTIEPLFPFGAGMSYTTFSITWASGTRADRIATAKQVADGIEYDVTVKNTGNSAGAKVVHAFVTPRPTADGDGAPTPPTKSLFGIEKVFLHPGDATTIRFSTRSLPGAQPFATVFKDGTRAVLPGIATVTIGVTARLSASLEIKSAEP